MSDMPVQTNYSLKRTQFEVAMRLQRVILDTTRQEGETIIKMMNEVQTIPVTSGTRKVNLLA